MNKTSNYGWFYDIALLTLLIHDLYLYYQKYSVHVLVLSYLIIITDYKLLVVMIIINNYCDKCLLDKILTPRHTVSPNITFRFQGFRVYVLSAWGLGFKAFKFYGGRVQDDLSCATTQRSPTPHLSFSGMPEWMTHFFDSVLKVPWARRGVWPYSHYYHCCD